MMRSVPLASLPPSLCVVIPHYARVDLLPRAIASASPWPVVVVDDSMRGLSAAPAGVVEVVRTRGGSGFSRAANAGLSAAQRLGFARALLLNDDAALEPGALDAMLAVAGRPGVGGVGPLLFGDGGVESAGITVGRFGRVRQRTRVPAGPTSVSALSGACLLVGSAERFDERFRHGMEDIDLCGRIRERGRRIYVVPEARCWHLGGASVSRVSPAAQRHAVSGHLRLVGGGWKSGVVVGLAFAQVIRERGPYARVGAVAAGWRDWRRSRA